MKSVVAGTIVPAGTSFIVNAFRLETEELARSVMVQVAEPMPADAVAQQVVARVDELVTRDAPRQTRQVLTLNVVDAEGRGGVSWQCLMITARVERARLALAVGSVLAEMVVHAVQARAETPAPASPAAPRVLN